MTLATSELDITPHRDLYPPIEPYNTQMVDVGDGQQLYVEQCGNPEASRWFSCMVALVVAVVPSGVASSTRCLPHHHLGSAGLRSVYPAHCPGSHST